MTLTYGHTVGEYIPTPLDIIGKSIYRGHHTNVGDYRMSHPAGASVASTSEVYLGTLRFDPNAFTDVAKGKKMLLGGQYGEKNRTTLTDILYKIQNLLDNYNYPVGKSTYSCISVRIFQDKKGPSTWNKIAAEEAITLLRNPAAVFEEEEKKETITLPSAKFIGGDETAFTDKLGEPRIVALYEFKTKDNLSFNTVRSPSVTAISYAKEMAQDVNMWEKIKLTFSPDNPDETSEKIKSALVDNIIDIWVEFVDLNDSLRQTLGNSDLGSSSKATESKPTQSLVTAKVKIG